MKKKEPGGAIIEMWRRYEVPSILLGLAFAIIIFIYENFQTVSEAHEFHEYAEKRFDKQLVYIDQQDAAILRGVENQISPMQALQLEDHKTLNLILLEVRKRD
jgi:hypothetical protein